MTSRTPATRSRLREIGAGYAGAVELTGLVLAGGGSRRMGRDKATLLVDGERLVDRAVDRLSTVCARVVVAPGARHLAGLAVEQVPDTDPGRGPLGGLVAGLEVARTPLVAVLAVDMPNADPAVLSALARCWRGEGALIPIVEGRPQPLHAVWSASSAAALRERLTHGALGVLDAAGAVGACFVEGCWPAELGCNINRPEDLPRAEDGLPP